MPIDKLTETTVSSEHVFDGRLLQIRRDQVRLPDGGLGSREYVIHPGAVMVIPVFDNGDLLIERQYRHPMGRIMIEFPAGKLDPGEAPISAARRELQEETGYTATVFTHFHTHHPLIAYSTERIEFFLARGLTAGQTSLDAGEFVETDRVTVAWMLRMLEKGEITDGKTVAGLLLALQQNHLAHL